MTDQKTDLGIDAAFRHLLEGRRLLIVGAASGIGRAVAALGAQSAAKLLLCDKNAEALAELAGSAEGRVRAADITDRGALHEAVAQLAGTVGGIDALIVTAGIGAMKPFQDLDDSDCDKTISVNLTGCFNACKAALPHMGEGGTIVLTSSATGLLPAAVGLSAYAASKSGLIGFARALSQELAPSIRVDTVCPGPVDTPLLPSAFRERLQQPGSGYPMQRAAEPAEIARLILFLVSNAASYLNGATIAIDGGRSLH